MITIGPLGTPIDHRTWLHSALTGDGTSLLHFRLQAGFALSSNPIDLACRLLICPRSICRLEMHVDRVSRHSFPDS
jgi:hypothetical protein